MRKILGQRYFIVLVALGMLITQSSRAELTIEITQGVSDAMPIAIVPFSYDGVGTIPSDVSGVIASDLVRSARFKTIPEKDFISTPHHESQVNYRDWRLLGVPNLVVGQVSVMSTGHYQIRFALLDAYKERFLEGYAISNIKPGRLRAEAHRISDLIYERLVGEPGAFSTSIMYVTAENKSGGKKEYSLQVADIDGFNAQKVLISSQPIMSPAWSADAGSIAYVSFEKGQSAVYTQEVATGKRERVSNFPGINGAPAWSPDGKKLAVTLSKGSNPDIYVLDLASRKFERITRSYAIDTSASWSPDGKSLVFTSDRGGKPHIYQYSFADKQVKRLTFEGEENARGRFSPDGRYLTMEHKVKGRYRIAVMEMDTKVIQVLTDGSLDESPSFAPNGSMIVYAKTGQNSGELATISVDGKVRQSLKMPEGDVREPAWAPFTK